MEVTLEERVERLEDMVVARLKRIEEKLNIREPELDAEKVFKLCKDFAKLKLKDEAREILGMLKELVDE